MGSWGPGLYQDDEARDLRNTIALLAKRPIDGEELLDALLRQRPRAPELSNDGGPTFWLVVADQFERRGLASGTVREHALSAIDDGADLRDMRGRDMSEADLRKRSAILAELRDRLVSPRPLRSPPGSRLPACPLSAGEVWTFPTMQGASVNPWSKGIVRSLKGAVFEPDGWGALLILEAGRAYDWFPWCAYASLTVPAGESPTIATVKGSHLLIEEYAQLAVPRAFRWRTVEVTNRKKTTTELFELVSASVSVPFVALRGGKPNQFSCVTCGWRGQPRHPLVSDLPRWLRPRGAPRYAGQPTGYVSSQALPTEIPSWYAAGDWESGVTLVASGAPATLKGNAVGRRCISWDYRPVGVVDDAVVDATFSARPGR